MGKDNMFISGGENIHPEEIERVMYESGMLDEAIVVGQEGRNAYLEKRKPDFKKFTRRP